MFKRKKPRTYWQSFKEFFYPRSGWRRALNYIGHRLKRLPDTPHKIALGFAIGAFVCFTPLFGLHFFVAAFLAWALRGNVMAALTGTFFGNPITFPIIAPLCYRVGVWMLDYSRNDTAWYRVKEGFNNAGGAIWGNVKSWFGYGPSTWDGVVEFFRTIMFPYFVGGIIPGLVTGTIIYFATKPAVRVYQNRRKGRIMEKFKELREKREQKKLAAEKQSSEKQSSE